MCHWKGTQDRADDLYIAAQPDLTRMWRVQALLSPLKSRSTNTIEACTISITDTDPNAPLETAGECRLVVRLHCQHGQF